MPLYLLWWITVLYVLVLGDTYDLVSFLYSDKRFQKNWINPPNFLFYVDFQVISRIHSFRIYFMFNAISEKEV